MFILKMLVHELANAARILCKVRHYVDETTLINLYYAFVYPHLKYGVLAWGNTNKDLLQKVTVMQNKIIRMIDFEVLKDHVNMNVLYK